MLKRAFVEGLKNITRSFWLSATAVSVLTVSFASVALVVTLTTIIGFAVRNLDTFVSVPAFIQNEYPDDQIDDLLTRVEAIPEVKEIDYFDRERARENLEQGNAGFSQEFLDSLSESNVNFAWRYILVTPVDSESYGTVIQRLEGEEFAGVWEDVFGDQEFVDNLIWYNTVIRYASVVLIVIFALISLLVMVNILRITIYNYKDEIEIMRLVGATNNYIRAPFIAEGVYYNIFAALIVTALFLPLFQLMLPSVESFFGVSSDDPNTFLVIQTYTAYSITILAGIIFGIATSYMATRRYLKL
jgi:cell division transport system permease protein